MKSELKGYFESIGNTFKLWFCLNLIKLFFVFNQNPVVALLKPRYEFEAESIRDSIKGKKMIKNYTWQC